MAAFVGEGAIADLGARQYLANAFEERALIDVGMKAHHVVCAHRPHQLRRTRQGVQQRRGHERRVQEEADPVERTKPAQFLGQREQVVVVDPDQIVFAQQPEQRFGEPAIDRPIGFVVLATKLHEAQPEMQQRPQRAIGEAHVERAVFRLGQIDRGVGRAVGMLQMGGWIGRAGASAAPAEPECPRTQGVGQCDRQPAGPWATLGRQRHPIGDDDEAPHTTSPSQ